MCLFHAQHTFAQTVSRHVDRTFAGTFEQESGQRYQRVDDDLEPDPGRFPLWRQRERPS